MSQKNNTQKKISYTALGLSIGLILGGIVGLAIDNMIIFAGEILDAVHLRTLTTHTLTSNVIDLKNGDIYIYYMSQYDKAVKLNIDDELTKGQRVIEIRSLFPNEIAEAGDISYRAFETRFFAAIAIVISTGLGLIILGFTIAIRKVRKRKGDTP